MKRTIVFGPLALVLALGCQQQPKAQSASQAAPQAPAGPAPGSTEWKIQSAMSAAPQSVSGAAEIVDFPADPKAQPPELRKGSNGWTCLPDNPQTPGTDPICIDDVWHAWAVAWSAHQPFHTKLAGLSYMLQGSSDASTTDPFKMQPDAGQAWHNSGPHVMWISPDPAALDKVSADPANGGAWVMFKGTTYAHVMIPVK